MEEQLKDEIDEIAGFNFITASQKTSHNET